MSIHYRCGSEPATQRLPRQLATTRLASESDVASWVRVPPKDVKQMLVGTSTPDDMHNDIWWLDDRAKDHLVDVRPGDRVVLSLEEIPSSGFMWRVVNAPPEVQVVADSSVDEWEPALFPTNPPDDVAGEPCPRAFLLEIDPAAGATSFNLLLMKDQPWDLASSPADRFEVSVSIHPPLLGIQLPPEALALRGR